MTIVGTELAAKVSQWLICFERALSSANDGLLEPLFNADSHWPDVLAFTWRIQVVSECEAIVRALEECIEHPCPKGFAVDLERTPPRQVVPADIEALFTFETADGCGNGGVRLVTNADGGPKARTSRTALEELKRYEEKVGCRRPDASHSRSYRGAHWFDHRKAALGYADRDPTVLVVGGGQAGLSVAARLWQLGVDTPIVDALPRIGDNWRRRYRALTLHNQVQVNHLPCSAASCPPRRRHLGALATTRNSETCKSGLWFIAGSLAQCRIYSKYLALQIKASELGIMH